MVSRKARYYIPVIVARSENLDADFLESVCEFVEFSGKCIDTNLSLDSYIRYIKSHDKSFYGTVSRTYDVVYPHKLINIELDAHFNEAISSIKEFEKLSKRDIDEIKLKFSADELNKKKARGESFDDFAKFSDPLTKADYEYWFSVPAWDEYECAILSVGNDPRKINESDFGGHPSSLHSKTVKNYKMVLSAVSLAMQTGELRELVNRDEFFAFSKKYHLPVEPMMIESFANWSRIKTNSKNLKDEDSDRNHSKSTYCKLIYVLTHHLLEGKPVKYDKQTNEMVLSLFEGMPFKPLSPSALREVLKDAVKYYETSKDEQDHG